jgi:hypothetical protein
LYRIKGFGKRCNITAGNCKRNDYFIDQVIVEATILRILEDIWFEDSD